MNAGRQGQYTAPGDQHRPAGATPADTCDMARTKPRPRPLLQPQHPVAARGRGRAGARRPLVCGPATASARRARAPPSCLPLLGSGLWTFCCMPFACVRAMRPGCPISALMHACTHASARAPGTCPPTLSLLHTLMNTLVPPVPACLALSTNASVGTISCTPLPYTSSARPWFSSWRRYWSVSSLACRVRQGAGRVGVRGAALQAWPHAGWLPARACAEAPKLGHAAAQHGCWYNRPAAAMPRRPLPQRARWEWAA